MIFQAGSNHDNENVRIVPKLHLPDGHTELTPENICPSLIEKTCRGPGDGSRGKAEPPESQRKVLLLLLGSGWAVGSGGVMAVT